MAKEGRFAGRGQPLSGASEINHFLKLSLCILRGFYKPLRSEYSVRSCSDGGRCWWECLARTGAPWYPAALCPTVLWGLLPLSPPRPQNLCLEPQSLSLPFPICSRVFTFLIPVLNNFSFSCPIHILHPALRVSDLWILL